MKDMMFEIPEDFQHPDENDSLKLLNCLYTIVCQRKSDITNIERVF